MNLKPPLFIWPYKGQQTKVNHIYQFWLRNATDETKECAVYE